MIAQNSNRTIKKVCWRNVVLLMRKSLNSKGNITLKRKIIWKDVHLTNKTWLEGNMTVYGLGSPS